MREIDCLSWIADKHTRRFVEVLQIGGSKLSDSCIVDINVKSAQFMYSLIDWFSSFLWSAIASSLLGMENENNK